MGCNCNKDSSHVSNRGVSSCGDNKCHFRVKVPCVEICEDGMMPPMPPSGGAKEFAIYLASFQALPDDRYIGLGTDGGQFVRHTVVIPENATITGLVFNIRDNTLTAEQLATAEIVISKNCGIDLIETNIIAVVRDPNCCGSATADYPINKCDLLSVRVSTGGGAFPSGAAATVLYTIP